MTRSAETTPEENDDVITKPKVNKISTMFIICREIFFILTVAFTAYATILNTQPKTKRGSPVEPFFRHPDIRDFYKGDLTELMHEITLAEFAFVMFYAPWDADSQDLKREFINVTEYYSHKVYFAGVNCWEPGSDCRNTFKDMVYHFPQLVAYIGPHKAVEYKGLHTADHMIRFIHSVINPINRIDYSTELWELRYMHNVVLVGHLEFQGVLGGKAYRVLYDTSLRLATHDHERHTAVAVFTSTVENRMLGIEEVPTIMLYLWNRRVEYKGPLNSHSLHKWVIGHTEKDMADLNSNTILPHMKNGAVMVMFTPRNPLSTVIPYYHLMRRVAMNFNFCSNGTSPNPEDDFFSYVLQFGNLYQTEFEEDLINRDRLAREKCLKMKTSKKVPAIPCTSLPHRRWNNVTCYNSISYCPNIKIEYAESSIPPENKKKKLQRYGTPDELKEAAEQEKCNMLERTPIPLVPRFSRTFSNLPTSCQINSSFSFIVLDSNQYSHLANGLGIQLKKMRHQTSVVIFDDEEVLKLNSAEVTEMSVVNMLRRYLSGERERALRSVKDTINFHNSVKEQQKDVIPVFVIELNTLTFDQIVLNSTKNVVVLYHSPYCSFCLGVSNLFLTIAYLLKNVKHITFARIDGELNDLPWEFTMHSYPSILFFPSNRKTESMLFPQKTPLTLHNLARFILSNLRIHERIPVMLALCSRWGNDPMSSDEGEACLQDVRITSLDSISDLLKQYRTILIRLKHCNSHVVKTKLKRKQRSLLQQLEFLKIAHLHLARIQDVQSSVIFLDNYKTQMV